MDLVETRSPWRGLRVSGRSAGRGGEENLKVLEPKSPNPWRRIGIFSVHPPHE
jgi:hypothetical protein